MRAATGPAFKLWDASSRDIEGASRPGRPGIVATPLSPFADAMPRPVTSLLYNLCSIEFSPALTSSARVGLEASVCTLS